MSESAGALAQRARPGDYEVIVVGAGQAGLAMGYLLGLTWKRTRGSALIGWVKDDAKFIADRIETSRRSTTRWARGDAAATHASAGEE